MLEPIALIGSIGCPTDSISSKRSAWRWVFPWYTGTESVTTKRILPGEKEKYVACAVTDGHGRVWVDAFITASDPNNPQNMDNQRAQKGVIALSRTTGDPGAIAYMSVRLPGVIPNPNLFFGDYIYTQAAFYPGSQQS